MLIKIKIIYAPHSLKLALTSQNQYICVLHNQELTNIGSENHIRII